jgi:hypothetical protein
MTAKAHHATPSPVPVVLFGIDSNGKPKAARFGKDHAGLAIKAASQLQLRVLPSDDPKIAAIAARLPVGRVHATGRTLVPFVSRDLYDKLIAAAPNGSPAQPPTPPASGTGGAAGKPPTAPPNRPRNWQEIGLGDLVIAQESLEEGWYQAIVLQADGDTVTLRWQDYPGGKPIVRNRRRLGLLYPGSKSTANIGKSGKPTTAAKADKSAAANSGAGPATLPKDWPEIQVGHLVLAQTEGPWPGWWEAVPVEQTGDSFKLQWRDYKNLPPVARPRFELALICPDA